MRERRSVLLAALLVASAGWPAAAFAPDESKADRTVIRTAQKQIHSQIVAERVEGIKRLRTMRAWCPAGPGCRQVDCVFGTYRPR